MALGLGPLSELPLSSQRGASGPTDVTINGQTLSLTLTLVAGTVAANANVAGQTLTATPVLVDGAVTITTPNVSVAGQTLTVTPVLIAGSAVVPNRDGAGSGKLWRIYQDILAAELKRKPAETKKRKRKKAVEPVLDLPIGGLDGLRAEIATERAAIAALDAQERARAVIRQRREAQERIEWLATQERALEAAIAEVERRRRKRNNETAMLLLAA